MPKYYEQIEHGVPHCRFERTPEGFRASFNKPSDIGCVFLISGGGLIVLMLMASSFALFFLSFWLVAAIATSLVLVWIGAVVFAFVKLSHAQVEVTGAAIIIETMALSFKGVVTKRQVLNRREFHNFIVQRGSYLGYTYGPETTFRFGGSWYPFWMPQLTEVTAALNAQLHALPQPGAVEHLSPDQLRSARPTGF